MNPSARKVSRKGRAKKKCSVIAVMSATRRSKRTRSSEKGARSGRGGPVSRRATCSPTRKRRKRTTCLNPPELELLRRAWNSHNPTQAIPEGSADSTEAALRIAVPDCPTEACWFEQPFAEGGPLGKVRKRALAPYAPKSWAKNPKEWLSSRDIEDVMGQYEEAFPAFKFYGASPIDFDKRVRRGKCVWDDLCKLSLARELGRGVERIGIILNMDPHDKPGSHWVTMFIDLGRGYALYFDSTGDPPPKEVERLLARLKEQSERIGVPLKVMINKRAHQRGDTECGVYGLYLIKRLLAGDDPSDYLEGRIPDGEMLAMRGGFFNLPRQTA